jgi:hypothetical protein
MFKFIIKAQATKAIADPFDINPIMKLWVTSTNNSLFCQCLREYMKLVEITVVSMLGSMENERTFSTFAFMKDKLCN